MIAGILGSMEDEAAAAETLPCAGDEVTLRELEHRHIETVLRRCRGNRSQTARILGIERKSLYRKAARLGITLDSEEKS